MTYVRSMGVTKLLKEEDVTSWLHVTIIVCVQQYAVVDFVSSRVCLV
jgi:hypothetical protein